MVRKLSSHLKIHVEDHAANAHTTNKQLPAGFDLAKLLTRFTEATGWSARPIGATPHHPLATSVADEHGTLPLRKRMQLVDMNPIDGMLDADDAIHLTGEAEAWALLEQIDALVQQLKDSERLVARQEAQLATAVGVSVREDESEILASRMQESLQRAVEQTGSDAAAIYLLDDATSELKMRSCYGLPTKALAKPPRNLRGSLADLEALMGNAVLIENTDLAPEWSCPEEFSAAMCLPIGSPTMPHGTIWLWSDHVRDFGPSDIDSAKSATDKILADIERTVLAGQVLKSRGLDRQFESASIVQSSRLPSLQRLHSDYEIGGWTFQGQALGGNFHTWTVNKHLQICAALGSAATRGAAGALVATSVQTVVETCWNANHKPSQVLRKANDLLWDAEDGDWRSALCYLQVHPESGSMQFAMAGDIQAYVIGQYGHRRLNGTPTMLAEQPDTRFDNQQIYLEGGELLVVASADVLGGLARGGFTQAMLMKTIKQLQDDAVEDIADHLARLLPMDAEQLKSDFDRSLMIVRRRF